jgi:hypothetical protein
MCLKVGTVWVDASVAAKTASNTKILVMNFMVESSLVGMSGGLTGCGGARERQGPESENSVHPLGEARVKKKLVVTISEQRARATKMFVSA